MEPSFAPAHQLAQEARPCADALADYPEFRAPGGSRYLKKLLRQILPMALYRTWEIFTDHQARGNDCYLSVVQLATLAGRSLRTMQKNIASLQARQLLIERVERKSVRNAEGRMVPRWVVVKDFTALYALAHEYHEWLHSEDMIPPERLCVSLLIHDAALIARLRRFDNYRRLLLRYEVIPSTRKRDDRLAENAHAGEQCELPSLQAPGMASKVVSKKTPKRINESSQRDVLSGDSFDSASPSSVSLLKRRNDAPQRCSPQSTCRSGQETQQRSQQPSQQQLATRINPSRPVQTFSHCPARSEHTPEAVSRIPQGEQGTRRRTNQFLTAPQRDGQVMVTGPQPQAYSLVCSFLSAIAVPFGDHNPKGSTTRLLNILAHASLEEAEIVLCLVRAYTIARDTRTIRSAHSEPGADQPNRMPLFCSLFERFVQARFHREKWNYSWQQLENDLITDDLLRLWGTEHQGLLAQKAPGVLGSQMKSGSNAQDEQGGEGESVPRVVGWTRQEGAHYWGEQLAEALMMAGYEAEVRVHLEEHWYQLVVLAEGEQYILVTSQDVQYVISHLLGNH